MFARLMCFIAGGGAAAHLMFLVVFLAAGLHQLALLNVGSVLLYLGVAAGLRSRRNQQLMATLAGAELIVHAWAATLLLGWDSGFHMYLLGLVPIVFIGATFGVRLKWLCMVLLALGYALLRYAAHGLVPDHAVPKGVLNLLEYFNIVAMVLLLTLGAHMHYAAVVRSERKLMWLASTDQLTGLPNRRHWLTEVQRVQRLQARDQSPYSVLLADIDHFKRINDRHGHAGGDEALRHVGQLLAASLRPSDQLCRWGGEEFAVLLPGTRLPQALRVAESLRQRVAEADVLLDAVSARLSMTIGAAEARAGEELADLLQRADAALYRGKAAGRNRVEQAPSGRAPASEAA